MSIADPSDADRSRSLRAACGRFATGVVIVAAATPDGPVGMAVNSFTSISLDPPLLGFGAARSSSTWPLVRAAGGFAISVLAAGHDRLCRRFAARGVDRFAGREWGTSPAGHPVLPDGLGWFDCTIATIHPAGDHDLVIATPTSWGAAGQARRWSSTAAASGHDSGRGVSGGPPRRPAPLQVTVDRRTVLTPHLVRITLTGDALERFRWPGPAGHLKLLLPEPGAAGPRPTMRTYTARRFDPVTRELDIDVVLHGDGAASRWAETAEPGGQVGVTVPRRAGFVPDPTAAALLLAGDASALPAIASILESGEPPAERTVVVELDDPADRLDLPGVTWLLRERAEPVGAALERAVADFDPPAGDGQAWVAAEAGVVRRARSVLLRRLAPDRLVTRGYWRLGASNHPDHDFGDTDVEQLRSRSGPPPAPESEEL